MKTIGLIGGMSWESSQVYYRLLNEMVKEKLGGTHSCKSLLYSVDFALVEELQHQGNWEQLSSMLIDIAKKLECAGAELLVICTNTMHIMAEEIQNEISIPVVHIVDAVAEEIKRQGLYKVGLLGTKFTMEQDFYMKRLSELHELEVIVPQSSERDMIHKVIYKELVSGIINEQSRNEYLKVIERLKQNGAEGVILGCTEIPLLINEQDSPITVFDTTYLHAKKAIQLSLDK